jgi:pimeloyl-[acyl-carrier protein] methyl ester esterase
LKHQWLHKQQKANLLIFCNGWGMDAEPVKHLASERYDVLMLYDYSHLESTTDIVPIIESYEKTFLVSWSMGVWAGQQLFTGLQYLLTSCLAINGTLCPIDDQYGIPEETVYATLENFDEKQRQKFYYRMCRDRELYKKFIRNQPKRTVADQKQELSRLLENTNCETLEKTVYDKAIVAEHDFVIPTQNQLQFWPEKMVKLVDGSHFLFYAYTSWDALLEMVEA